MKKIFFLALLMAFVALPFASALTGFDPVKNYDDSTQTVTVQNTFLFVPTSEIGRVTLINNTDSCGGDLQCSANMKLVLNQDYQVPLSNIEMTLPDKVTPYNLKDYSVYIKNGTKEVNIIDTGPICNTSINGTISCIIGDVGSHLEIQDDYRIFNEGESLTAGTYYFKLVGHKNPYDSVEWIPTFLNFKIEEWATWGPTTLMVNRTSGSTTAGSSAIGSYKYSAYKFNATANFTLRAVQIYGTGLSGSVTMRAGLFTNNASNQPNSTQIGNWSDANITAVNNAYQNFTWSKNDTNVTQNKIYWIVFDPLGTANFIRVGEHGGTPTIFICTAGDLDHWGNTCGGANFDGMNIDIYGAIQGSVTLNSPANNSNYSSLSPTVVFNGSMTPAGSNVNATLYIWNSTGSIFNQTTNTLTGTGTNSTTWNVSIAGYADGNYQWNVYGCDTTTCIWANNNFTFSKDTIPPSINILRPFNSQVVISPSNITLNFTVSDSGIGPSSCWYNLDSGSNTTISCSSNTTFATIVGDHILNMFSNDSVNNVGSNVTNFTVANFSLANTFTNNVLETSTDNYTITTNSSGNVFVNGVNFFTNSGGNTSIILNSSLGNLNFYNTTGFVPFITANSSSASVTWIFNVTYNSVNQQFNVTTSNQSIFKMLIDQCGSTTNTTTLNYTTYYESNRSVMGGTSLKSTFFVWLPQNYQTTSLAETYSFNRNSTSGSYPFCIYPAWASYQINTFDTASNPNGFSPRNHIFNQASVNNQTQNVSIYLLDSTNSTATVIKTVDPNLNPIPLITVRVQRYYPELNQYIEVDNGITDNLGQTVVQTQQFYATYKFLFYNGTNLLLQTDPSQVVCYSNPCVITYVMNGTVANNFQNYLHTGISYSLGFNNNTNNVTFVFTDANGLTNNFNLLVQNYNATGTTTVCNASVSGASGTAICGLSGQPNGTYFAQAYYNQGGTTQVIDRITANIETNAVQMFGKEGLFWSLFFILEMAMVGMWNPAVAVGMVIVGIISIFAFGFVSMSYLVVVSMIILGGVVISQLKT